MQISLEEFSAVVIAMTPVYYYLIKIFHKIEKLTAVIESCKYCTAARKEHKEGFMKIA